MGKDKEGKFHPRKGKPSSSKIEGSSGVKEVHSETLENYLEIAEKYTVGEEQPAPNVNVRHPNRNVDKAEERRVEKPDPGNKPDSINRRRDESSESSASKTSAEELPALLSKEQLTALASHTSQPCISVYMETHHSGVEKNEQVDTIAFKNVLQQITYQLRQKDVDQVNIDRLLKAGYDLLRDQDFWFNLSKGLAVFISDDEFKYIKLPFTPKEELLVNSSYYLGPLVPLMVNKDYFYILVFSKKQAKLYRADQFGIVHIPIPEMPNGIDDVVRLEEKDDQKLFRTDTAGAGQGASFHGMGAGKPDDKANIKMYFDEVDETLWKAVLSTETAPLMLAGVEYMMPIFKSVSKYRNICSESLTGSYEHENIGLLYEEAVSRMQPFFLERHTKALEMYNNSSATPLTSSVASEVIPAAYYKRVWHLFVKVNEHIWGTFDEMKNEIVIHKSQQAGDEDLMDKAVLRTLLSAGEVHFLEEDQMPDGQKIAALMRYDA